MSKPTALTVKEFFAKYAFALSMSGLASRLGKEGKSIQDYIIKYAEPDQLAALEREIHALGRELLEIELVTPEHKLGFMGVIQRTAHYDPRKGKTTKNPGPKPRPK
jgi:hypothetical protein